MNHQMSELNNNTVCKSKKREAPAAEYITFVIVDIILALILGIITDNIINRIASYFKLNFAAVIVIQIILITLVIYMMKEISPYIHHEPLDNYSYDVIFVSVYMTSQPNIQKLINMFISSPSK